MDIDKRILKVPPWKYFPKEKNFAEENIPLEKIAQENTAVVSQLIK